MQQPSPTQPPIGLPSASEAVVQADGAGRSVRSVAIRARLRRDAAEFGKRWSGESDRRGMVLIMTMLMTTVLALLGSAATMSTASQLRESSATRLEHTAMRVGEAGTMATIALAAQLQSQFETYVVGRNYQLDLTDAPDLYNWKSKGSFGLEQDTNAAPNFKVQVAQPKIAYGVAGYDAARYCFRSYGMKTTASIGDPKSKSAAVAAQSGQVGFQANVIVGPVPCGG